MPGRVAGPSIVALIAALTATAVSAEYVPYSGILHGTKGLSPLAFSIANDADGPVVCTAQMAHWYTAELGVASPGEAVTATLWHNPDDGVLALMNATDDQMPVEAVWCAPAVDPAAPRSRVALPVAAGPLATDRIAAHCRTVSGGLVCDLR